MTRAQKAAWAVYIERINMILREQSVAMEKGWPQTRMILDPPNETAVAAIEAALAVTAKEAREVAIHDVLGPVVTAIDAIDNSRTKKASPAVRELYETLDGVYKKLHRLKTELPPSDDAVDPHAADTGKPTTREGNSE